MALQPDNKVIVGAASMLVRLNPDGTPDNSFTNNLSVTYPGGIQQIIILKDSSILVGGSFFAASGAIVNLARLTPSGAIDQNFTRSITNNWKVTALALQSDAKILVALDNPNGADEMIRLEPDGARDYSFKTNSFDFPALAIAMDSNGAILAGGEFQYVNGVARPFFARFKADGVLDDLYLGLDPAPNLGAKATVQSLLVQPDGKILLGGSFKFVNGFLRHGIARLNLNGTLDRDFGAGQTGLTYVPFSSIDTSVATVYSVALQTNGNILIGGSFSSIDGQTRHEFAQLNSDGSLDYNFAKGLSGPNEAVYTLLPDANGKILLGGYFTRVNNLPSAYIARVQGDRPPAFSIISRGPMGTRVDFRGPTGQTYLVERARTFRDWTIISPVLETDVNGFGTYTDTLPPLAFAFYRVRVF